MMCSTEILGEPDVILYADPIHVGWLGVSHIDRGIAPKELTSVCNTLLQVLLHVPALLDWLSKSHHPTFCRGGNKCLLCDTHNVFQQLRTELVIHPDQFCNIMKDACDDPHIVMEDIISELHLNFLSSYSTISMNVWGERTSPVYQIFGGLWKVSTPCCGSTYKPFFTVKVPLTASSVQLCLDGLHIGNICEKCGTDVMSVSFLHAAPVILILNLQRFLDDGSFCDKEILPQPDVIFQKRYSYSLLSAVFVKGNSKDAANFHPVTFCPRGVVNEFTDASFKKVSVSSLFGKSQYLKTSYMLVYELKKVIDDNVLPSEDLPLRGNTPAKASTPLSARPVVRSTQKNWEVSPIAATYSVKPRKTVKKLIYEDDKENQPEKRDKQNLQETSPPTFNDIGTGNTTLTTSVPGPTSGPTSIASTSTSKSTRSIGTQVTPEDLEEGTTTSSISKSTISKGIQVTPEDMEEGGNPVTLRKCWTRDPTEFRFMTGVTQENFLVLYKLLGGDEVFSKLKMEYKLSTPTKNEKKFKYPLQDRLFLTLVRLRRGTPLRDLAFAIGISKTQAGEIFYTVLRHMYLTFLHFKDRMFLTVEDQKKNIPKVFNPFKNLRMIIDGAEFKLQVPTNFQQQGNTYSDYKACNTAHFIIGINLYGGVCFVSAAYEGAISDKEAVIDSKLLEMLKPGDALMADRGFELKAECMLRDIKLLRPPSLGSRNKFTPKEVLLTKAIAKARIYIEHTIGKIKAFRLLRYTIPNKMIPYVEDMVYVCACLTNFDPPHLIMKKPRKKSSQLLRKKNQSKKTSKATAKTKMKTTKK